MNDYFHTAVNFVLRLPEIMQAIVDYFARMPGPMFSAIGAGLAAHLRAGSDERTTKRQRQFLEILMGTGIGVSIYFTLLSAGVSEAAATFFAIVSGAWTTVEYRCLLLKLLERHFGK